ncbi:MAG: transcriptional regulator NanR [Rhodovibrionaceae bacterium]
MEYVIERKKLSDQVLAYLQAEIVSGKLRPGDHLPSERDLMENFGVGRPTIREALFSLQRMGLVALSSGSRARVTEPTPQVILNELSGAAQYLLNQEGGQDYFQQARAFLELGLARFAAVKATTEDLRKMEEALATNEKAIGDGELFKETDIAFHYVLAEIPRNPIFLALHQAMADWLTDQRATTLRVQGQERIAFEAHEKIYNAILKGDPNLAEQAMENHLEQLFTVYRRVKAGEPLPKIARSAMKAV